MPGSLLWRPKWLRSIDGKTTLSDHLQPWFTNNWHTVCNISYVDNWNSFNLKFRDNSIEPVDAERLSEFVKLRAYEKITLLPPVRLSQIVSMGSIPMSDGWRSPVLWVGSILDQDSQHIMIFSRFIEAFRQRKRKNLKSRRRKNKIPIPHLTIRSAKMWKFSNAYKIAFFSI